MTAVHRRPRRQPRIATQARRQNRTAPAGGAGGKSQGKALTLLDASEVQLDGAATLVLTFSVPLQPDQDFSRSVHLVDKKSGKVDGAWELAPNLKELRLASP
ncbi:alpha-2-macroglobulin [Klebsiella pneumoniae]|uniref:Alpha-2-macroglobulin n=1 Tax=Klebsiella pneumoniae TaxID=573 RepID=A0A2X3EFZ3_KLEPN|nr:alpha-2-macroglobulin [Klebsiella pneumoniae]